MSEFLPYGRQTITDEDVHAVADALRAPMITTGPLVNRFEQAIADYVGARHAVAFATGTAALHGAAFAAGLGAGDELVTTPLTFAASGNCALYQGASVRLVDIERGSWNLDLGKVVDTLRPETKAVVAVDFAGLPIDLSPLDGVRENVVVIEDAAHAIGARRPHGMVGGAGGADMTCFSFHPVKSMTTGEGGLVTTEDDRYAERLRMFRTHGIVREGTSPGPTDGPWYYEMQALGFNYRITDFQCALGLSQLTHLDEWVARRNELAALYRERLDGNERIEIPPEPTEGTTHGRHLYPVRVTGGAATRLSVFNHLRESGIGVQVHYIPIYRLPYYRDALGLPQDECPEAERYYEGAISLPMFPAMDDSDVDRVVAALNEAL